MLSCDGHNPARTKLAATMMIMFMRVISGQVRLLVKQALWTQGHHEAAVAFLGRASESHELVWDLSLKFNTLLRRETGGHPGLRYCFSRLHAVSRDRVQYHQVACRA